MSSTFRISVVIALFGIAVGIGIYTFVYAKGFAYFTNDPQACVNCHVMREQYDGWIKSSHRNVAACNDCHMPKGLRKWVVKADNGFWHALKFTTQRFHEPIQIRKKNLEVTEQACMNCHGGLFERSSVPGHKEAMSCVRCHGSVGHPK